MHKDAIEVQEEAVAKQKKGTILLSLFLLSF